jgi:hypothetical protein
MYFCLYIFYLKTILTGISIATLLLFAFWGFWLIFALNSFFFLLTFNLFVSLALN